MSAMIKYSRVNFMIYENIKMLREENDWTQQYIANLLFINRRTYSAYETGTNSM
ncbi:MAG: helix-turn-helix transcriptional regulator, partial [Oscillospiraceae bacterium]